MIKREIRNYEVSVWSLQDDFISVLKAADIGSKGQIQNGIMTLNVDGTQEFSFSIPMYLHENGEFIENPTWYNYINGILISNMRKIKLIINKNSDYEDIYEFLIVKVTEKHEKNELYCDVECEGLAFHELGKTGYKVSLSSDDFYNDDLAWFNQETDEEGQKIFEEQPIANIQYWLNKFMKPYPTSGYVNPAIWYYTIDMDWTAYTQYADGRFTPRARDKIYEEEYVSAWAIENEELLPKESVGYQEKARLIDSEESNKYNLTQDLAETFGVYCKYVYEHDKNYYITARRVIFYNAFVEEDKGPIDITYKYHTSEISREMDGSELVTKMYVRPVDSDSSASGLITIMDVPANKSREDYLLNFDYVHAVGGIDDDIYNQIPNYEKEMHRLNLLLVPLENKLVELNSKLPEAKANLTLYTNAVQLDQERFSESSALYNNLTGDDGVTSFTVNNPKSATLLSNYKSGLGDYYFKITEHGIKPETIHIYRGFNSASTDDGRLTNEIFTWKPEFDEFQELIKISGIFLPDPNARKTVWMTYDYEPKLYFERVQEVWRNRLNEDNIKKDEAKTEVNTLEEQIKKIQAEYNKYLKEKQELIEDFEHMMGPALREGYWQPEDFNDYGDRHAETFILNSIAQTVNNDSEYTSFIWDSDLFDDEEDISYLIGADQQKEYYPCVDLSEIIDKISDKLDTLSFLFYDYIPPIDDESPSKLKEAPQMRRVFSVGSQSQLAFVKNSNNEVKPVLLLTGAKNMSSEDKDWITDIDKWQEHPECQQILGCLTTTINEETVPFELDVKEEPYIDHNELKFIELNESYKIVYPRIQINSLSLKNSTDELALTYNGEAINKFEDYSVLTKMIKNEEEENEDNINEMAYFITLKPKTILQHGLPDNKELKILYTLSNADTSIYLDAREVLKDSSQPQVSYTLNVSTVQEDYIKQVNRMLNRIVHINDYELKFDNVQGYISQVTVDLDHPWEDKIEIKNYKTKFEDLFTKIVASTEEMKKNSYVFGAVSQAFNSNGTLQTSIIQNTLDASSFNYKFNNGKLTINNDGILAQSDNGILAIRGGGIFGATQKENSRAVEGGLVTAVEDNGWIWEPFITPEGISASALIAGQLDTNKIRIFAGDQERFQWNENGIFAYKSFFSDFNQPLSPGAIDQLDEKIAEAKTVDPTTDLSQYVTLNENGLFLIARPGALILNEEKTAYHEIEGTKDIERVAINWDGLTLRNYEGDRVFYADADTGNLTISGTIDATGGNIGIWNINEDGIYKINPTGERTDRREIYAKSPIFIKLTTSDGISRTWFEVDRTGVITGTKLSINNFTAVTNNITIDGTEIKIGSASIGNSSNSGLPLNSPYYISLTAPTIYFNGHAGTSGDVSIPGSSTVLRFESGLCYSIEQY